MTTMATTNPYTTRHPNPEGGGAVINPYLSQSHRPYNSAFDERPSPTALPPGGPPEDHGPDFDDLIQEDTEENEQEEDCDVLLADTTVETVKASDCSTSPTSLLEDPVISNIAPVDENHSDSDDSFESRQVRSRYVQTRRQQDEDLFQFERYVKKCWVSCCLSFL